MIIGPSQLLNVLTTPTASTTAREDRQKAAAETKLREAMAAAETLKERRNSAADARKAAARQKIEQLKAQLQMLQSMASGDPKGMARLAAQLARELGSAVKAYAAAGGMTSGMGMGVAPTASAGAATPTAEAGTGDAAQAQPGAATDAAAKSGETGNEDGDEGQSDGKAQTPAKPANPYQQAIDEAKSQLAEMSRRGGETQADADFMADVRQLAAQIRQLVRMAVDKAPGDKDALSPDENRQMKGAVEGMDRAIGEMTMGGGVALSITV